MAERTNATVLKTVEGQPSGGSNPPPSAQDPKSARESTWSRGSARVSPDGDRPRTRRHRDTPPTGGPERSCWGRCRRSSARRDPFVARLGPHGRTEGSERDAGRRLGRDEVDTRHRSIDVLRPPRPGNGQLAEQPNRQGLNPSTAADPAGSEPWSTPVPDRQGPGHPQQWPAYDQLLAGPVLLEFGQHVECVATAGVSETTQLVHVPPLTRELDKLIDCVVVSVRCTCLQIDPVSISHALHQHIPAPHGACCTSGHVPSFGERIAEPSVPRQSWFRDARSATIGRLRRVGRGGSGARTGARSVALRSRRPGGGPWTRSPTAGSVRAW